MSAYIYFIRLQMQMSMAIRGNVTRNTPPHVLLIVAAVFALPMMMLLAGCGAAVLSPTGPTNATQAPATVTAKPAAQM